MVNTIVRAAHKNLEHKRCLEKTNAATTRRSSADGTVQRDIHSHVPEIFHIQDTMVAK